MRSASFGTTRTRFCLCRVLVTGLRFSRRKERAGKCLSKVKNRACLFEVQDRLCYNEKVSERGDDRMTITAQEILAQRLYHQALLESKLTGTEVLAKSLGI